MIRVNKQYAEQVSRNKAILRVIIAEIETCGRMNLPLRGHSDSGPLDTDVDSESVDFTQGNLRCLLQKAAIKDATFKDHLKYGPRNASYLSPETQNHLVTCIGKVMLRQICTTIKNAKYFAIAADETSDVHKLEQLTLTARYIDTDICERFLGFIEVNDTTGQALGNTLLARLEQLGLDRRFLVAQAYDGASAMSGVYNGTRAVIQSICPSAIYVHCAAHCLNLVLSKSVEIQEIRVAVTGVQDACNYFKHSAKRIDQLEKAVQRLCPQASHSRLKQYCATRWVERHDSMFVFLELYDPLMDVLHNNGELSLAGRITDPQFIIAVLILRKVMGVTKGLSQSLQAKELELTTAVEEIEVVVDTLKSWRSDEQDRDFKAVFIAASELYARVEDMPGIDFPKPRLAGRQSKRNNVPADNAETYYKRAVWYPLLDCMLLELQHRFSSHSKAAMSMSALTPAKCTGCSFAVLADAVDIYGTFLSSGASACNAEYQRWQRKWEKVPAEECPTTAVDALKACNKAIYPNIAILMQIFATIPVTTATAERSFSSLRLLKTYLRSTMKEDRLNGPALMAVHKDVRFKHDDVITEYAATHNRRFNFQ